MPERPLADYVNTARSVGLLERHWLSTLRTLKLRLVPKT